MSLAQRVRDHRYSKGWGPDELASRAAISRTALYQIESGKTELPRAGTLRRIALALDVSMEILLGHGDAAAIVAVAAKPARANSEWLPTEGGPLTIPSTRTAPTIENLDGSRFGVESTPLVSAPQESYLSVRERELAWKLHELLSSNLGEGIARIIEESYRLLPSSRHVG
ncbi:helix-turn-helix transcriptional regulator [Singulisphaera sp. Ch08]|uniref:Helix-turn-helix transcriptional regulator n=1 Tax=Singulisphaera sp. Ch08 TaxID=3120278 RepID=A0AAU7CCE7_9BACT